MKPRLVLQNGEAAVYEFNGSVFAAKVIKPARQVFAEKIVSPATLFNFDVKVFSSGREVDSMRLVLYSYELRCCEVNADLLGPLLVQALHDDETTLYCVENPRVYKSAALQIVVTTHVKLVRSDDDDAKLEARPEPQSKEYDAIWLKPNIELQRYVLTRDMAAALYYHLKSLDLPSKELLKKVNFFSNLNYASEAVFDRGEIDGLRLRLLRYEGSYNAILRAVQGVAQRKDHTNVAPLLQAYEWLCEDHYTEDSDGSKLTELRAAIEYTVSNMKRSAVYQSLFEYFDKLSAKQ